MKKVIALYFSSSLLLLAGQSALADEEQKASTPSSSRNSVPTGDTYSDRQAKDPEIESAPPPRPIVRDRAEAMPLPAAPVPSQTPSTAPPGSSN